MQRTLLLGGLHARCQVLECLDEETTGAAGTVEHDLTELGIDLLDDEPDDRARCVELAGVAGSVAHLAQHRLVEVRHRVDVVGRREVDLVDFVDDVAQQVAGQHPVVGLLEHRGEHVPRVVRCRRL